MKRYIKIIIMTMIMSTVLMNIVFADSFNNQSVYEIYNKVSMYNGRLDNGLYMSPMRNINQNDLMWKVMYGEGYKFYYGENVYGYFEVDRSGNVNVIHVEFPKNGNYERYAYQLFIISSMAVGVPKTEIDIMMKEAILKDGNWIALAKTRYIKSIHRGVSYRIFAKKDKFVYNLDLAYIGKD